MIYQASITFIDVDPQYLEALGEECRFAMTHYGHRKRDSIIAESQIENLQVCWHGDSEARVKIRLQTDHDEASTWSIMEELVAAMSEERDADADSIFREVDRVSMTVREARDDSLTATRLDALDASMAKVAQELGIEDFHEQQQAIADAAVDRMMKHFGLDNVEDK